MSSSMYNGGSWPQSVPVTIAQTNVSFDGAVVQWFNEQFTQAQLTTPGNYWVLGHTPLSASAVQLTCGGTVQRIGVDFSVTGNTLVMLSAPRAGDVYQASYMAYVTVSTPLATVATGLIMLQASQTPQAGWVMCDGATQYSIVAYPALYAFAVANSLTTGAPAAGNFILKLETVAVIGGGTLYSAIKT